MFQELPYLGQVIEVFPLHRIRGRGEGNPTHKSDGEIGRCLKYLEKPLVPQSVSHIMGIRKYRRRPSCHYGTGEFPGGIKEVRVGVRIKVPWNDNPSLQIDHLRFLTNKMGIRFGKIGNSIS